MVSMALSSAKNQPDKVYMSIRWSCISSRFCRSERVLQRLVAVFVVMTVGFAVGRDVHELRPGTLVAKAGHQPAREAFTIGQQTFKRDRARNRPVIKKQVDAAARRQPLHVGA